MKVFIVPGFMGTSLFTDWPGRGKKVWLDYWRLARGGLRYLALAPDGRTPADWSDAQQIIAASPLTDYYGPLVQAAQGLGNVFSFGTDWRTSAADIAVALGRYIAQIVGNDSCVIIAHSQGGLIARGAVTWLASNVSPLVVTRLVTLATPHYGSVSPLRVWGRIEPTYIQLLALTDPYIGAFTDPQYSTAARVAATWPALYELMPSSAAGPYYLNVSLLRALYAQTTYQSYQPSVTQARLDAAKAVQTTMAAWGDPAKTVTVIGRGTKTAVDVADAGLLNSPRGYAYSADGDSQVGVQWAAWQGATKVYADGVLHGAMPYDPLILRNLSLLLTGSLTDGQVLT